MAISERSLNQSSDPKYAQYKFTFKSFVGGALRNENFTGSMWIR